MPLLMTLMSLSSSLTSTATEIIAEMKVPILSRSRLWFLAAIRGMEQRAMNKLRSPFGVHTQQLMAYLDFAGIDGSSLRKK